MFRHFEKCIYFAERKYILNKTANFFSNRSNFFLKKKKMLLLHPLLYIIFFFYFIGSYLICLQKIEKWPFFSSLFSKSINIFWLSIASNTRYCFSLGKKKYFHQLQEVFPALIRSAFTWKKMVWFWLH